jgi:two-component system, cell cycle response regulator
MGSSADRDARERLVVRRRVRSDRVLWWAGAAASGWIALFTVLVWVGKGRPAFGEFVGNVVYLVPDAAFVVLAVTAAWVNRGRTRRLWAFVAGYGVLLLAGDLIWAGYAYLAEDEMPFPSAADAAYLSAYLLAVPAMLVGFGQTNRMRWSRGMVDTALVLVGVGAIGWQVFVGPQLDGSLTLAGAVGAAYPLADVAVVGCLIAIGLSGHRMVPYAVLLTGAAFVLSAGTDLGYTYLTLFAAYEDDSWLNIGWQGAAVLFCLAALVAIRHREAEAHVAALDRDLTFLPVLVGTAATCGLIAVDAGSDGLIGRGSLALAGLMLAGLLLRQWMTTSDRTRLAGRLQTALQEQERLAVTDPLTGLYNRRFFQEMLRLEADRVSRQPMPLALVVLDLDHFKRVNDTYGHPVGDIVLMQAADRIRQVARDRDIVARYGGEEFVCIAPGADEHGAVELAERFRQALRRAPIPAGNGRQLLLTVSVGVAVIHPTPDGIVDVERLLHGAEDSALYQAKAAGRDRVVLADHPQQAGAGTGEVSDAHDTDTDTDTDTSQPAALARWCQLVGERIGRNAAALAVGTIPPHETATVTALRRTDRATEAADLPVSQREPGSAAAGRRTQTIPIEARILAVCSAWAATRANRSDAPPMTTEQARDHIHRGSGSRFDPWITDAFLALLEDGALDEPPHSPPTTPPRDSAATEIAS